MTPPGLVATSAPSSKLGTYESTASDPTAELELVGTWLTGMAAKVDLRGFVSSVKPTAVCAACSCPRGDQLLAFPSDQESAGLLSSAGFADLYVP